ncbi:MAG TPA: hypothetical protein VGN12_28090 [Pirellulales bacterium]|jgi:hypothetical protein
MPLTEAEWSDKRKSLFPGIDFGNAVTAQAALTAKTYEVILNGGGAKYYVKGNALGQILECYFTGSKSKESYPVDVSATQGDETARYVGHGYGFLLIDYLQLSTISFFELIHH